nr:26S proteasome non-ATPase regulatory subunit 8 homolog A-like [Ipomoea batatas]
MQASAVQQFSRHRRHLSLPSPPPLSEQTTSRRRIASRLRNRARPATAASVATRHRRHLSLPSPPPLSIILPVWACLSSRQNNSINSFALIVHPIQIFLCSVGSDTMLLESSFSKGVRNARQIGCYWVLDAQFSGLKLLRLLVQNRIVEFHTELELPSPNAVENPCILGRTTVVLL